MNFLTNLPVLLLTNLDRSWPPEDIQEAKDLAANLVKALIEVGHPVTNLIVEGDDLPHLLQPYPPQEYIVLNWCEEIPGIPRSSALVAQRLEEAGFTYTGSSSTALTFSQNKPQVKHRLQEHHISTPTWQVFTTVPDHTDLGFPAIVKPAYEHCSFGITREAVVQSPSELIQRIRYVVEELQEPALVEDFIDGREFHVGVIGNGRLEVLPPAEMDYSAFSDIHDRLCTYEANFDRASRAYQLIVPIVPAGLTEAQLACIEEMVIAAYQATGCRDYARMDLRLRDGVFYLLDVNPNADISPDTSLVKAAALAGYSYGHFGSLLVNLAAKRHPTENLFTG